MNLFMIIKYSYRYEDNPEQYKRIRKYILNLIISQR
ncbi:hypothetical protein pb186bvf_001106, partial [Paramecium bursaria]